MTLSSYIWGVRAINLVSLSALVLVIYYIDPQKAGIIEMGIFYLVLFFSFSGIFNLLLLGIRKIGIGKEAAFSSLSLSFRQGMLLALLSVALLVLQSFRMLIWWDGLLVIAGIFLIELYFLSRTK